MARNRGARRQTQLAGLDGGVDLGAREPSRVFEFVIVLVLISTVGKVVSERASRPKVSGGASQAVRGELDGLRDTLDELNARLQRLEQERDFYRDLLDAPASPGEIGPPTEEGDGPSGE